ncbi:50S ribosomal protein L18e [Candidatus Woesearchaeota archaeon]|nr:50S ribosomal protein L18e [Candidatus Woesearchaeota archaeon]
MVKRTGSTNEQILSLISVLQKEASVNKIDFWKRIAFDLNKPSRQRREVNISKLNRHTQNNETVIVPGKVLGSGSLDHPLVIAALTFSQSARNIIEQAKGKCLTIGELLKQNPQGKNIRIIG